MNDKNVMVQHAMFQEISTGDQFPTEPAHGVAPGYNQTEVGVIPEDWEEKLLVQCG